VSDLIPLKDAARQLGGVSVRTLEREERDGRIIFTRIRSLRFIAPEELERYVAANAAATITKVWNRKRVPDNPRCLSKKTHGEIISKIVNGNHNAVSKSFHKVAWAVISDSVVPEALEDADLDYRAFKRIMPLIPDAYAIDHWRRKLTLFEAEINSRLTAHKLQTLAHFGIELALLGWLLTLIRVDEFGRMRKEPLEPFLGCVGVPEC